MATTWIVFNMATESAPNINLSNSAIDGRVKNKLSIAWAVLSPVANLALMMASDVLEWVLWEWVSASMTLGNPVVLT